MRRLIALLALCLWPALAAAQDDKGFLTNWLEENLSDAGRQVVIVGFQGALSSRASLTEMTIADDLGIWLTLRDVTLDWDRAALLRGRVEVSQLTAGDIIVARAPHVPDNGLPAAKASRFKLPELPVAVSIGTLSAQRVELGAALLGTAAVVTLQGSMQLSGGEGAANIAIRRIDGAVGALTLTGSYANGSRQLALDLSLQEAQGGIAAAILRLPGVPAIRLDIAGAGLIDDFTAKVALQSDGQPRLTGVVQLIAQGGTDPAAPDNRFRADLSGDIAPLFASDYRSFFGPSIRLIAEGARFPSGRMQLSALEITAQSIRVTGSASTDANGLPEAFELTGHIATPELEPLLLPLPGGRTQVTEADLVLAFDAAKDQHWSGSLTMNGLQRAAFGAATVRLTGSGRIARDPLATEAFSAEMTFAASGFLPADPAWVMALGTELSGKLAMTSAPGALQFSRLELDGNGYGFSGKGRLGEIATSLRFTVSGTARIDALARFSDVAGRALAGSLLADGSGSYELLTGAFDLDASLTGRDLSVAQPETDRLLRGESRIILSASRTTEATFLHNLSVRVAGLQATAKGQIAPGMTAIDADLNFADLTVLGGPYGGAFQATAQVTGPAEHLQLTLSGTGQNLTIGQAAADRLLRGESHVDFRGLLSGRAAEVDNLTVSALGLSAAATGRIGPDTTDLAATIALSDLQALGSSFGGAINATAHLTLQSGNPRITLTGTGQNVAIGQSLIDRLLQGETVISLDAMPDTTGADVTAFALSSPSLAVTALGRYQPGASDLTGRIATLDLAALGTALAGQAKGQVHLKETGPVQHIDLSATATGLSVGQVMADKLLAGETSLTLDADRAGQQVTVHRAMLQNFALSITAEGLVQIGASRLATTIAIADLASFDPRWHGSLTGTGTYSEAGTARNLALSGTGTGVGTGGPQIDRLMAGTSDFDLDATEDQGSIRINGFHLKNRQMTAQATVSPDAGTHQVQLQAVVGDLSTLAPGFHGPLTVAGTLVDAGGPYRLNLTASGSAALNARVTGITARNFRTASLAIAGTGDTALFDDLIAPRTVQGSASYDVRLEGPISLTSLSGTVRTTQARLITNFAGAIVEGISGSAILSGGRAVVAAQGAVVGGGVITVTGPVAIVPPYAGDLTVGLRGVMLYDRNLYQTSLDGTLTVRGPVTGGALIAGQIDLGQTEVRLPSTGLSGIGELPAITHLHEPADVRATRARAGLLRSGGGTGVGGSAAFPLNITLSAPRQVFIRGRGLDAELGGTVQLGGTTSAIVPLGEFRLIRGRLDILGRRFTLDEGLARLQGHFVPFIRLVASTSSGGFTTSILIEGDAAAPKITFQSVPELPQEEVLARLLFGRTLTTISPLQAAQLAGAVATLAGSGGEGIVGRLRKSFGLDDLDIQADATGIASVRVGKYLSDNVYTDITVGADGKSDITLNLDISPSVTLRGSLGSGGNTGLGVFFERDY